MRLFLYPVLHAVWLAAVLRRVRGPEEPPAGRVVLHHRPGQANAGRGLRHDRSAGETPTRI